MRGIEPLWLEEQRGASSSARLTRCGRSGLGLPTRYQADERMTMLLAVSGIAVSGFPNSEARDRGRSQPRRSRSGFSGWSLRARSPQCAPEDRCSEMRIGRMSYGLYLWHFLVVFVLGALSTKGSVFHPGRSAVAWLTTFTLATISFGFLERPILKVVHHKEP